MTELGSAATEGMERREGPGAPQAMKVLVVDDEEGLRKSLSMILEDAGYTVLTAPDGEQGLSLAEAEAPDLILCDVRMPGIDGLEFLRRYREGDGSGLVLVMTAYGSLELAVEAMTEGAYDYIPKPFDGEQVLLTLRKAEEREQLRQEVRRLRNEVRTERKFGRIVARSPATTRALDLAGKVAPHPSSVLVTGDTGTGKELLARLIHDESTRPEGPFTPVNCGAIPENLLESEFFGHARGAFSGADRERPGLLEASHGGTLFLDEVGELSEALQVKLLRSLQDGEVRRLGETQTRAVDFRVVAATNRDLLDAARQGRFREDLYYRLAVVTIHLPPLRERTEEIPHLARHFLDIHAGRLGIPVDGMDGDAMDALMRYPWPGNIRELENVLEHALILLDEPQLTLDALPSTVRNPGGVPSDQPLSDGDLSVKRQTAALEKDLIRKALERTAGNRSRAADLLELSSRALRYKIQEYGLD